MTGSNQDFSSTKGSKKNTIQGAQAFHRAITLLKLIANNNQKGMRLVDVAYLTGLTIPTTHRLLQALVAEKLLYKIENSNLYAIGALVYELGFTAKSRFNVLQVCTPIIELLARKTSAAALLHIKSDDDVICLVKAEGGSEQVNSSSYAGGRSPLGACAAGVALLSALPLNVRQEIIQRNAPQYGSYLNKDASRINACCEIAQTNGYALIPDALHIRTLGVAVPVLNHQNESVASVSVLLTDSDELDNKYKSVLPNLKNAASDITLLMGGKNSLWEL